MLQETLHYPSTPPPAKDGWNLDPKVFRQWCCKMNSDVFLFASIFENIVSTVQTL